MASAVEICYLPRPVAHTVVGTPFGTSRRLMTPNGKIYSRKRTSLSAQEQAQVAQAIKRARFMALLPYTSATM